MLEHERDPAAKVVGTGEEWITELGNDELRALFAPSTDVAAAVQLHEPTTELPHAVSAMIDRHARMPKLSNPTLEEDRASGHGLEHEIEIREIDGVEVRGTNPAKTVADCFRQRQPMDSTLPWRCATISEHRGGMNALVEAARADRLYPFMRPYLEALA